MFRPAPPGRCDPQRLLPKRLLSRRLLSQRLLAMPRLGCINGHGSRLPAYRGAAPIQWCIVNGDTVTGMTTMRMNLGMDTGDMLLRSTLPIGLLDTAARQSKMPWVSCMTHPL